MLQRRRELGKPCEWRDADEVMDWWLADRQTHKTVRKLPERTELQLGTYNDKCKSKQEGE